MRVRSWLLIQVVMVDVEVESTGEDEANFENETKPGNEAS